MSSSNQKVLKSQVLNKVPIFCPVVPPKWYERRAAWRILLAALAASVLLCIGMWLKNRTPAPVEEQQQEEVAPATPSTPPKKAETSGKEVKVSAAKAVASAPSPEVVPVPVPVESEPLPAPKAEKNVPVPPLPVPPAPPAGEQPLVGVPGVPVVPVVPAPVLVPMFLAEVKLQPGGKLLKVLDPPQHVDVQLGPNPKAIVRLSLRDKTGQQFFALDKGKLIVCQLGGKIAPTIWVDSTSNVRLVYVTTQNGIRKEVRRMGIGEFDNIPTGVTMFVSLP